MKVTISVVRGEVPSTPHRWHIFLTTTNLIKDESMSFLVTSHSDKLTAVIDAVRIAGFSMDPTIYVDKIESLSRRKVLDAGATLADEIPPGVRDTLTLLGIKDE